MPRRAFTLVELLVVIAILGLLSTVAIVTTNSSRITARNAKRKADLTQLSKILEAYYYDNGGYPYTGAAGTGWSGTCAGGGSKGVTGAGGWIPNLAPNYISVLPRDPTEKLAQTSPCAQVYSCYLYWSDGVDYKLIANCTPEGTLSASDPFNDPARSTISWAVYTPGARSW